MFTEAQLQKKTQDELVSLMLEYQRKQQAYEATMACLNDQIKLYQRRQFAKKSEKYSEDDPQYLLFNEAMSPSNLTEIEAAEEEITVPEHTRKKRGRKPLPKDLPRKQEIHDLPESEKVCACGCELTCIGEQTSEQLDIIPAKIYVIEHVYKKYACKQCEETIKQAKAPLQPIPKSIASAGMLAHVLVSKYCDGLPLYRQETILQRIGVDIPRVTMSHWVIKCANLLKPLYKLMTHQIQSYDVAYSDETKVQVLREPNRAPEAQSYMWCFGGGPPDKFSWLYHYSPSRGHEVIEEILEDFKGHLHIDGYRGYETFADGKAVTLVGCWYHVRRYFVDADKVSSKRGLAFEAIRFCKKLANIERDIKLRKLTPEQTKQVREHQALPIIKQFKAWLDKHFPTVLPKSPLGKAMQYAHNQWPKLLNYLKDGRLEISNNRTERAIKPFVIGRKAWLFSNTVAGVEASCVIYSLIETCKAHNVEPYDYLRKALTEIPSAQTEAELEALLPYNIRL